MSRPSRGFSILELVVTLAILSALSLSAVLVLGPQLTYFRARASAKKVLSLLRDQQAQAARAGYVDAGGRGGGVLYFRGRVVRDNSRGEWVVEDEESPDAFCQMACPVDHVTDPERPSVRLPAATKLSQLSQDELATVSNLPDVVLYRDQARTARVESGDYVVFAERALSAADGGLGSRPLDRGASVYSPGLQASREIFVSGPDDDPRYGISIDGGGLVHGRAR
ncbi:MAG: type II secretion system protein [Candidatus Wallbacteria bacterium]|nr:type II secretion system protein [Candidatus Wallbacteria bacterium]